jgi:hypothetical protein
MNLERPDISQENELKARPLRDRGLYTETGTTLEKILGGVGTS